MKLKAIIIDDESKARSFLSNLINEFVEGIEVVGTADSVLNGIKLLKTVKPDLIFLDVEMPGGTGFDFLDTIDYNNYKIIFTTAHSKFAVDAFQYRADGYLLKPIDLDDLIKLSEDLKPESESQNLFPERITFKTQESIEYVDAEDIIRIESDGNYSSVFRVRDKKLVITKNMKQMEAMLGHSFFIKSHKSHLINAKHIVRFVKADGGHFEMIDGSKVPLSRRNRESILKKLEFQC
ncbi:MAG: two-component system LytT family response regulator [Crocinitomix sp.]|jgi:two-component system LytT family response regulator